MELETKTPKRFAKVSKISLSYNIIICNFPLHITYSILELRYYFSGRPEILVTETNQLCADAKGLMFGTEGECQNAAEKLGLDYGYRHDESTQPKGCYFLLEYDNQKINKVMWNTHESGRKSDNCKAICKSGNLIFHLSFV